MRKNIICFVISGILAVNCISALAAKSGEEMIMNSGGKEPIITNIVDAPELDEFGDNAFELNERYKKETEKFYSYGSDYAYKDIDLRGDRDFRYGIYDEMLESCKSFADYGQNVSYDVEHKYSFDTVEYAISGITEENFNDVADYYFTIIAEVYSVFKNDHPEFYWLSNEIYMFASMRGLGNSYNLSVGMYMNVYDEYADAEYRNSLDEKIEDSVQDYIDYINKCEEDDNYSIAKLLHDKIIDNVDYAYDEYGHPLDTPQAHSIVGVLDGDPYTNVVCEGYAKTYQLILNAVGVENVYVTGYAFNGIRTEAHAWNMVKLDDGEYYNFDVTWDDQILEQFRYDYFAKGRDFYSDHFPASSESAGTNFLYDLPAVPEQNYIPPTNSPDVPTDEPAATGTPESDFEIDISVEKIVNDDGSKGINIVLDKIEDDSCIFVARKNQRGEITGIARIPIDRLEYFVDIVGEGRVEIYTWKDSNSKPLAKMNSIEF